MSMKTDEIRWQLIHRVEAEGVDDLDARLPFIMYHRPLKSLVAYLDENGYGSSWADLADAKAALDEMGDES